MNPLTNMKNVLKLSEQELQRSSKTSWHDQYRDSAWIFIGGLPYDLTEGDIVCIFSQYGEPVNINLIRDKDSGKSKGFCFLCYEDQRSTDLAVDNLNGIKILNRTIRVDHVNNYKVPKQGKKTDEETKKLYDEGCAPKPVPIQPLAAAKPKPLDDLRETLADQIIPDMKLPQRLPIYTVKQEIKEEQQDEDQAVVKRDKKSKKKKKSKKSSSSENEDESTSEEATTRDKEKVRKRKKAKCSPNSESNRDERRHKHSQDHKSRTCKKRSRDERSRSRSLECSNRKSSHKRSRDVHR